MCDVITPTMMLGASLAMTAASTGLSMYSQSVQQKTQENAVKASAQHNAAIADNEAVTQGQLAQNEIGKSAADRARSLWDASQQKGALVSDTAASGFQVDSGTPLSALNDFAVVAQHDANTITHNGNQKAFERMMAATGAENQKSMLNSQYANAGSGSGASMLGMGGTLLGGIASGMGQYKEYKKTAIPTTAKI